MDYILIIKFIVGSIISLYLFIVISKTIDRLLRGKKFKGKSYFNVIATRQLSKHIDSLLKKYLKF